MDKQITTTVLLDAESWRLLHELARLRAERLGGKPSQSAVVRELVHEAAKPQGGRHEAS